MKLRSDEERLDGQWELRNGGMSADATSERIERLIAVHLKKVATDSSGWDTLYQDPQDGRYWELLYLQSELQGGGPPTLVHVEKDVIREKYDLDQGR
jgi:hypothetical protein